jgi:hypothetical protein
VRGGTILCVAEECAFRHTRSFLFPTFWTSPRELYNQTHVHVSENLFSVFKLSNVSSPRLQLLSTPYNCSSILVLSTLASNSLTVKDVRKMPPSKPKPSEIAAEAKKTYIPYIRNTCSAQWPSTSYLCYSETMPAQPPSPKDMLHCRFGASRITMAMKSCH